jgi:hypothetical protein
MKTQYQDVGKEEVVANKRYATQPLLHEGVIKLKRQEQNFKSAVNIT